MTQYIPRRVVITGATSGIGRATSVAFARLESELLVIGRRADRLEQLAQEVPDARVTTWALDIRDVDAIARGASENSKFLANADVLVNNAGLAVGKHPLQDSDPADWDAMIDTNLKGLLRMTHLVLPYMVKRGSGHIVNLGSITGRQVYRGGAVYAATKFGVRAITEALRHDILGTGVRVTSIDPGMVETEFSLVRFEGDAEAAKKVYAGMRPLTPDDVAESIVWATTRPPHVNVQEILLMPTDQAAVQLVHRQTA